jgi:hypothetical protein
MDDTTWTDTGGDYCSWYYSNADSCGSYGDGAYDACCACGGGSSGSSTDSTDMCMDDYSWIDDGGDDCDWYYSNSGSCGSYGVGAYDACCACDGGMGGGDWTYTGECYDDMGWYDNDGDDCSYYSTYPESCGDYGAGAYDSCCACGGGIDTPNYDTWTDSEDECQDDYSWSDTGGDDCDWYYSNSESCGSYGSGAWDACCACGGGDFDDWDYNGYDNEPMDWEWYLDEASDLLPQEGQSWSLGPVTVTYDAASKLVATFGAAIMATAIAY